VGACVCMYAFAMRWTNLALLPCNHIQYTPRHRIIWSSQSSLKLNYHNTTKISTVPNDGIAANMVIHAQRAVLEGVASGARPKAPLLSVDISRTSPCRVHA
jgi:hypothetical protein